MEPSFSEEDRRYIQLEVIFRTHFADIYHYFYRQVRHAAIAEDLTSAVFLKALRWLQQDRSPESVKGWLYATARSILADYWREQAQLHLMPLEFASEMPMLSDKSDEQMQPLHERVQHLLDGLTARERDVLTLRYFQGYSAVEIGQMLGLSAKYVRVLQLRALRRAASFEAKERSFPVESPAIAYDDQALRALELAEEEARALNHNYIGTEHVLLGILHEGSAATELIDYGVTLEGMRGGIAFIIGRPEWNPPSQIGYTPRTKKVLSLAGREAQRVGEATISPQHLLVAILREGQGIAAQLLQISDVRLEQVGDTTRIKVGQDAEHGTPVLPLDLQLALAQHPEVRSFFEKLSYTKQKRFIDWIEQTKGEDARRQQIEKTIAQLEELLKSHRQPPQ